MKRTTFFVMLCGFLETYFKETKLGRHKRSYSASGDHKLLHVRHVRHCSRRKGKQSPNQNLKSTQSITLAKAKWPLASARAVWTLCRTAEGKVLPQAICSSNLLRQEWWNAKKHQTEMIWSGATPIPKHSKWCRIPTTNKRMVWRWSWRKSYDIISVPNGGCS